MKTILFVGMMLVGSFANAISFKVVNDGEVGAYFVGAIAAYENQMTANFSDVNDTKPYISNRGATGEYFSFGYHEAGSTVVFEDYIIDTGYRFYSVDALNGDALQHIQYSTFNLWDSTPYSTPIALIGFEDIYGGGDLDFNDNVVAFTNITAVPEPATYAMLLVGLGLIGFATRRGI